MRVEEEGGRGLGVLLLETMAALQAHLVGNVPHSELLCGRSNKRGLGIQGSHDDDPV